MAPKRKIWKLNPTTGNMEMMEEGSKLVTSNAQTSGVMKGTADGDEANPLARTISGTGNVSAMAGGKDLTGGFVLDQEPTIQPPPVKDTTIADANIAAQLDPTQIPAVPVTKKEPFVPKFKDGFPIPTGEEFSEQFGRFTSGLQGNIPGQILADVYSQIQQGKFGEVGSINWDKVIGEIQNQGRGYLAATSPTTTPTTTTGVGTGPPKVPLFDEVGNVVPTTGQTKITSTNPTTGLLENFIIPDYVPNTEWEPETWGGKTAYSRYVQTSGGNLALTTRMIYEGPKGTTDESGWWASQGFTGPGQGLTTDEIGEMELYGTVPYSMAARTASGQVLSSYGTSTSAQLNSLFNLQGGEGKKPLGPLTKDTLTNWFDSDKTLFENMAPTQTKILYDIVTQIRGGTDIAPTFRDGPIKDFNIHLIQMAMEDGYVWGFIAPEDMMYNGKLVEEGRFVRAPVLGMEIQQEIDLKNYLLREGNAALKSADEKDWAVFQINYSAQVDEYFRIRQRMYDKEVQDGVTRDQRMYESSIIQQGNDWDLYMYNRKRDDAKIENEDEREYRKRELAQLEYWSRERTVNAQSFATSERVAGEKTQLGRDVTDRAFQRENIQIQQNYNAWVSDRQFGQQLYRDEIQRNFDIAQFEVQNGIRFNDFATAQAARLRRDAIQEEMLNLDKLDSVLSIMALLGQNPELRNVLAGSGELQSMAAAFGIDFNAAFSSQPMDSAEMPSMQQFTALTPQQQEQTLNELAGRFGVSREVIMTTIRRNAPSSSGRRLGRG